ncbi:MAG: hypothetical protein V1843_02535 [bacterium]
MVRSILQAITVTASAVVLIYLAWKTYKGKGWKKLAILAGLFLLFLILFFLSSAVFAEYQILGIIAFMVLSGILLIALYFYYRYEAAEDISKDLKKRGIKT